MKEETDDGRSRRFYDWQKEAMRLLADKGLFVCIRCCVGGDMIGDAGLVLDSSPPIVYCKRCAS